MIGGVFTVSSKTVSECCEMNFDCRFYVKEFCQIGSGRRPRRQRSASANPASPTTTADNNNVSEDDDDEEEEEDNPEDFCTVVGVWERGGSRSRRTLTETIEIRFHRWEDARRPDLLLARCLRHLLQRVLAGRAAPMRLGISLQPPGWDNAFHVPMRPPEQNSPDALAAALEDFAKQYDALDLFSADVRFKVSAIWPLGNAEGGGEGACADTVEQARGSIRCQSYVPILNGAGLAAGINGPWAGDRWCLARSVLIGLADRQICVLQRRPFAHFRAHCQAQQGAAGAPDARMLLQAANIPLDLPAYGLVQCQQIQRCLDAVFGAHSVRLVVIEREAGFRVTWKGGNEPAQFDLCLVLQAGHFGYIQRPAQLFHAHQFCVDCERVVNRHTHPHGCRAVCYMCFRFGWGFPCQRGEQQRCAECRFVFPNADCFAAHLQRVNPPPPGWQHDRRRRPHRSMCEERRICEACGRISWARYGAHNCGGGVGGGANAGAIHLPAGPVCRRCDGPHDPEWTPHFIQPRSARRQFQRVQPHQQADDGAALADGGEPPNAYDLLGGGDDDDNDAEMRQEEQDDEGAHVRREKQQRPIRFLFWDVECAQERIPDGGDDRDDEEEPPPLLKHTPVLICAELICERCVSDGVDLEREPERRAVDCCCGAPWGGEKRRQWALPIGSDAFDEGDERAAERMPTPEQMPPDGLNPRRLRFFRCERTGRSPMECFLDFLLNTGPLNTCTLMLAHNGGRYDVHLFLEELQQRGVCPRKLISTGLRVYTLELGGNHQRQLVAKDTLNFYGCALAKLPATFGLDAVPDKPYFPYGYISEQNMDVVRVEGLPAREMYDPDRMRTEERAAFMRWYDEQQQQQPAHQPFVLRRELLRYCANDVRILRRATLRFREIVSQLADGMEPFMAASTIAGLALAIYRQCHLPPNVMVHTPEGGFLRRRRASAASRLFFALLEWERPVWRGRIRTAQWSIGEECVEDDGYRMDGVIYRPIPMRPLAIEYNGCYYHGCPRCFTRRQQRLAGGLSAEVLYARTLQREWELSNEHGYEVRTVWECEFRQLLARRPALRRRYKELCRRGVPGPMDLRRDALFGGRVEPFALYYACAEGEEIDDLDIISLYPFVMKMRPFPIGMAEVLTREQLRPPRMPALPWTRPEQNPFKGFLQCRVLPPTPDQLGEHHTLLPYRTLSGRLTFPLCRTCAEAANPTSANNRRRQRLQHRPLPRCRHTRTQRAWTHAYSHVELNAALALGYRVLDIYEVWNYTQWASLEDGNSLFAEYVDKLMRIKAEASGWPANCNTDQQRAEFVRYCAERDGIQLNPQRVQFNPGLRAVAKALLNSLWGKLGQRAERDEVHYTDTARRFHDLLEDTTQEMVDFVHLNDRMDRCVLRKRYPFVRAPPTNNLAVACFVTAHARVYLHERLEEVRRAGGRPLYCDTDSVLFVKRCGTQPLPTEGDALGQLKREWPGRRIVEFFSAGPKNYGFRHVCARTGADERAERKIRGLQLTHTASQMLPFRRMLHIVLNFFGRCAPNAERRVAVPTMRFVRTRRAQIHTRAGTKLYQPVYTKGLVVAVPNATAERGRAYFTRPFGWHDEGDHGEGDEEEEMDQSDAEEEDFME